MVAHNKSIPTLTGEMEQKKVGGWCGVGGGGRPTIQIKQRNQAWGLKNLRPREKRGQWGKGWKREGREN